MSRIDWAKIYERYQAYAQQSNSQEAQQNQLKLLAWIGSHFPKDTPNALQWWIEALADEQKKWFVARVMEHRHPLPQSLLAPMIRAGVREPDPSRNRAFIQPCVQTFGGISVQQQLLHYVQQGTNPEKAGAMKALFWTGNFSDLPLREQIWQTIEHESQTNPDPQVQSAAKALLGYGNNG